MSSRLTIQHFIGSVVALIISLLFMALKAENRDINAASMYLIVYGFLVPVLWAISWLAITLLLPFFAKRKLTGAAFAVPSLLFLAGMLALQKGSDEIVWAMIVASSVVNLVFYLIYSKKEVTT